MEGYIGEIRMFGGNFAPRTWAFCEGQLLPIAQNQALFSIIGTMYGGDGRTTFALPDLRGRVAMGAGHGPGLSDVRQGAKGGQETVTLTTNQIPSHNHSTQLSLNFAQPAVDGSSTSTQPGPATLPGNTSTPAYSHSAANTTLKPGAVTGSVTVGNAGGNQPHENRQPWIGLRYIICLQGIFPSRS